MGILIETNTVKKNKMKILTVKSTDFGMKNSLDGLNSPRKLIQASVQLLP